MRQSALQDGTYTVLVAERKRSRRSDDTPVRAWSGLVLHHSGVAVGETASGTAVAFRSAGEAVRCAVAVKEAQETASELALGIHRPSIDGAQIARYLAALPYPPGE